jgi:hypothetical protein
MAINDFLEYCSMLSRKDGTLKRAGKNFSKMLSVDFTKESTEYIKRITDFMYFGDTMLNRYYLNALQSFIQRLRSKFGLSNTALMYFACPSEDNFLIETRRYLRKLFENYAKNKKIYKIVLDQAISPINISKTLRYFDNAKLIIVDRDPRDIYATMINEKRLLGGDIMDKNSVYKYIAWHHAVRKKDIQDIDDSFIQDKVLRLNFEDFFLHYERTIGEIKKFLNIEFSHKEKGIRFNCEDIDKHVGIWKNVPQQDAMKKIGEELKKDCYVG